MRKSLLILVLLVSNAVVFGQTFGGFGRADRSFGRSGVAVFARPDMQALEIPNDIVALPSGGFIVCGARIDAPYPFPGLPLSFYLRRFNADGSLDANFAAGGLATEYFGGSASAVSAAVQADGKILVGGTYTFNGAPTDFIVARFEQNGALDATFGNGGAVVVDFGQFEETSADVVNKLLITPDGKIIVAGYRTLLSGDNRGPITAAVVRLGADGAIDTSYGFNGKVFEPFLAASTPFTMGGAILTAQNGLFFGFVSLAKGSGEVRTKMVKLTSTGEVDQKFGNGGESVVPALGAGKLAGVLRSGESMVGVPDGLMRFWPNGQMRSLVVAGTQVVNGKLFQAEGFLVRADERVIAHGFVVENGVRRKALAGFLADGQVDVSFGTNGLTEDRRFHTNGRTVKYFFDEVGRILGATQATDLSSIIMYRYGAAVNPVFTREKLPTK